MRIKVIEKSTGIGIATEDCFDRALQKAREKQVASHDMQFVIGEPDVELYEYARNWAGQYRWLVGYFKDKGAQDYFVEAARSRLELWQAISTSRIVDRECDIAPCLAAVIGEALAADVVQLIRMDRSADCQIYGPDIKRSWADAAHRAVGLSRRYNSRNFVLAVHEDLGAIVVAPDYKVAINPAYIVRDYFSMGRRL